uniref:C3H1-type domain-containing protein n=1 Tax=Strigamia maritima TaxID=126957 RepID=T1IIT0_STRMM
MKYQQPVVMPASVQDWLDHELEVRGIDAVVYTRYILSILQQDNELVDTELFSGVAKRNPQESPGGKEKSKLSADRLKLLNCDEMKKSAAIECLMSVSEQKCGIEKLVDELCDKLKIFKVCNVSLSTELEVKDSQETQSNMIDIRSLTSSSPKEEAGIFFPTFSGASGNVEPSVEPKNENSENDLSEWNNFEELNEEQKKIGNQLSDEKDKMHNDRNEINEETKKEAEDKLNFIMGYIPFNLMHSKSGDVILDNWQACNDKFMPSWYLDEKRYTQIEPIGYNNNNNNNLYKNGKQEIIINENSSMQNSYVDMASGNSQETENDGEYTIEKTENLHDEKLFAIEDETEAEALGEAELLAKLAAKFNDDVASIWSDQRDQQLEEYGKSKENIWQMLPFYRPEYNLSSVSRCTPLGTNSGRKFVWPQVAEEGGVCNEDEADNFIGQMNEDLAYSTPEGLFATASKFCHVNSDPSDYKRWNRSLYSSFANLEIDCSSPQEKEKEKVEEEGCEPCSPVRREEEMQFIWQMLDNALHSEQASCVNNEDDLGFLENYQRYNHVYNNEWHQLKNNSGIAPYLQTVWDSSALQHEVNSLPYGPFNSSSESLVGNDYWQSEETSIESVMALTRSYDSYLNKIYPGEGEGEGEVPECAAAPEVDVEAASEPTLSPKNCTLTYHKGESCFVEVTPSSRSNWDSGAAQLPLKMQVASQLPQTDYESEDNSENLLTSPKTHFRPIRQDSCETDTTGSSDDSALVGSQNADDQMAANSKSVSPIFINCRPPDEESSDESNFIPQISKSNKEKFCQTDDIVGCAPRHSDEIETEARGLSSVACEDSCTEMLNAVIDVLDNMLNERGGTDGEEATTTTTESNSSTSVSPPSSRDEPSDLTVRIAASDLPFRRPMYGTKTGLWDDLRAPRGTSSMLKWSTAQEENEEQRSWNECTNQEAWTNVGVGEDCDNVASEASSSRVDKIKALRDEIRDEEEKLFDDINFLRVLNLEDEYENSLCTMNEDRWVTSKPLTAKAVSEAPEEEECNLELERIHCNIRAYSSSDGDEIACPDTYSDYFGDIQAQDSFGSSKLPLLPSSKVLYSTDLEEEWKKDLFDAHIPKNRAKQKSGNLKRPCSFYMEGNCRRTDCKFSHDLASITCRFWLEGSCFKGVTCPFLHGFQKDKEDNEEKADFTLELQSEAHFPALSKPKVCPRKKDFIQSSSSDSTPVAKNKRQRKRFSGKERHVSPNLVPKHCKTSRQSEKSKRPSKSSSSEEELMDV